jgi:hypothetical protein
MSLDPRTSVCACDNTCVDPCVCVCVRVRTHAWIHKIWKSTDGNTRKDAVKVNFLGKKMESKILLTV